MQVNSSYIFISSASWNYWNENISFFLHNRMPTKKYESQRKLWIESIENFQTVDYNCRAFNVCIDHFKTSQIVKQDKDYALAPDAIPSIFTNTLQRRIVNIPHNVVDCNNCVEMKRKNSQLTSDNLAGDIQRQSMQKQIDSLMAKLSKRDRKLNDTQKELQSEILENKQLRGKITQLVENVCSTIDTSNVMNFQN